MKQRKTIDTYEIQGNYGYGWECVTTELTLYDANKQARIYNENEPQYAHRVRLKREPFNAEERAEQERRERENALERMRARMAKIQAKGANP